MSEDGLTINRSTNQKAFKAGLFYTICNFLVKAIGFITMPIFTRIMSKSDIGYFSNLQSWISVLSIMCTLELSSSLALAKYDYKNDFDKYVSSNLFLSNIFTILCYLIIFLFKESLLPIMGLSILEFHLCFAYILVYPALQMFQQKQQVFFKYKESTGISLISVILSTVFSILLVFVFSNKYLGRLIGYFTPLLFVYLILSFFIYFKGRCVSYKYWKYALVISVPIIFHLMAGFILSTSDRIMITYFCGAEQNAYYSVAYSVSSIIQLLWFSVNAALAPWSIEQMNCKSFDLLKRITKTILLLFGVVCVAFSLMSPEIMLVMGGKDYSVASNVLYPIICGCVFQAAYTFYVNAETFLKKQVLISIASIIAALINIILNIVFIPLYGYVAAAYTTLIGYACLFILHFCFLKTMKKSYWFDTTFIVLFLFLFVCFSFFMIFIANDAFKRYVILTIFVIIVASYLFSNKKTLLHVVSLLKKH